MTQNNDAPNPETDDGPPPEPLEYRGHTLDRFQADAITALQQGQSVLVCAPTGTGKTMVADWLVEDALAQGKEVIYTAPVKALSNQKFRDYCKLLGEDKVGLVTGDLVIRRDAPCRVMTTEILRNMLLSGEDVPDLAAVIIDEIHFLDDRERGTTWEEVLIYLPSRVRIVGLSATLSNVRQFSSWLSEVRGHPVSVVEEYKRAVPLTFRVATREGRLRTPKDMGSFYKNWARRNAHRLRQLKRQSRHRPHRGRRNPPRIGSPTRHTDIFELLWPDHAPYLYFVFSRRDTESMARSLARKLDFPLLNEDECEQVKAHLDAFCADPGAATALDPELAFLYRTGVAFHHAGLHVHLKALVEELYEKKLIKVLYCTGTFALGINMPARTAVFDRMERFDGRGMIPLPAREFMQMAGRAGRRGLDDEGLVVTRCPIDTWPELEPQLMHYLKGRTEPVRSRFGLSFNSVVNLLARHERTRVREIVERSFLAFHRRNKAERDTARAADLAEQLVAQGWVDGRKPPKSLKRDVRVLHRLRAQAETAPDQTWAEFEDRIRFLRHWGYLASDDSFQAGAKALMHVQINEIFVVEVFLQGFFDDMDDETLYGVCCAMCAELPRAARTRPARRDKGLIRQLDTVRDSEIVLNAEELTGSRAQFDGQLIPFGRAWAGGRSLSELLDNVSSQTDIAGDLVGAFRRARDLVGQIRGLYSHDPERADRLLALTKRVKRDEVEVVD